MEIGANLGQSRRELEGERPHQTEQPCKRARGGAAPAGMLGAGRTPVWLEEVGELTAH